MNVPIRFNNYFMLCAVKVGDIPVNRVLAPKLQALQSAIAQLFP
jgi:hypothetical protein